MNLIKSYIIYNVSGTVSGSTVSVDGVTIQGDGSSGNPLAVIAGVFDPAGSAAAAQSAAATDATTKANAAVVTANAYTDAGLATKVNINNTPTVITDGAAISLTTAEHTLSTAQATISVTDSYSGDYSGLRLTLNGITQVVLTFVTGTALCAFNGTASGNNTMTVTGVAGDRVEIHRKKLGTNYTYVALNVGQ